MMYGYARVSTKGQAKDGNSLEAQERALKEAGAKVIYKEAFTGTKKERPQFNKLLEEVKQGDTIIVTKLDRVARSATQGIELINGLIERGITLHILNMGVMDNTPTGKLIRTVFFGFAEFERDMIVERTTEGKAVAKENAAARGEKFKEGRPEKYKQAQIENALHLLENHSYNEVVELTGISRSTLIRMKKKAEINK